jgi:DNA-binding transcriptional LysR family regulator
LASFYSALGRKRLADGFSPPDIATWLHKDRHGRAAIGPATQRILKQCAGAKWLREYRGLDGEPFILMKEGYCLGNQVLNFCEKRDFRPRVSCRSTQIETIQALVKAGWAFPARLLERTLTDMIAMAASKLVITRDTGSN